MYACFIPISTYSEVSFFHSLERSGIGDLGATTLADALRANQSLKILKYVMILSLHKATNKFRSMICSALVTFCPYLD